MAPILDDTNQPTPGLGQEVGQPKYILYSYITLAALNFSLSITATVGNMLILVALQKESSLHPPSKLLYKSLAFTDLCVGVTVQPSFASFMVEISADGDKTWNDSSQALLFTHVAGLSLCGVSLNTLSIISFDRLLAMSLGLRYRQIVTLRRVLATVILVWLSAFAVGILRLWYARTARYLIVALITLNLLASTCCYTKIYVTIHRHHIQVHAQGHCQPNGGFLVNIARYRRTVSSALSVHLSVVACYLPYVVILSLWLTVKRGPAIFMATGFTASLLLFNSSLNPVLYCWRIREVKIAVKQTLRQICCL